MGLLVDIIVGSEVYSFYDGVDFVIQDEDGFGLPPSHLITERSPLQHGVTVRDFRLDPRIIFLGAWGIGKTESDHYERRDQLIKALKLSTIANQLRYTLTNGTRRQIDFFYMSGLSFSTGTRRMYHQKSLVSLYCPDPLFYDPDAFALTFAQVGGASNFEIPHPVPHIVGSEASLSETKQVSYSGSWLSYPHLIRIYGPITDPVITNTTIDKKLDFTGTTISNGDYYDIDLRFGHKTIVDSNGTKKIADLTDDSDLADWFIGHDPEVPGGDNSISATGTSVGSATKIEIAFTEKFIGF